MKDWKMAVILLAILSASAFIVLSDDDSVAENESTVSPNVISVEYNSLESTNLVVTTDVNFGNRVCMYNIRNSAGAYVFHGPSTSSSNVFTINTEVATIGYIADDSFRMYFDNRTVPYTFDIVKVTFNGNGTAMKSVTAHLSTDSLSTYSMPSGYIWNTARDGSGAWISNLSDADIEEYALTLYAFKGNNVGISLSAGSSAVTPGSDAVVLVNLDNNAGIAEIDLSIEYDRSVLTLQKVTSGDILTLGKTSLSEYPFTAVLSTNENIRTIGNLLRLTFSVDSGAAVGEYPVLITVTASEDMYGKIIPNTVTGCSVTVGEKIRGDLSGDNSIDTVDSTILMSRLAYVDTGIGDSEFDLNGDGVINALDSLIMMKYLYNEPVSFANSSDEGVTMTVANNDYKATVEDIQPGDSVYVVAEGATSVTASTASGSVTVTAVANSRYMIVAPSQDFTVKVN